MKSGFASGLNAVGYITITLGVIIGVGLLDNFSQAGMFSEAGLSPTELVIVIGVAFYHVVFGMLCIGVSLILQAPGLGKTVELLSQPCPKCGEKVDVDSEFCAECGAKID